MTWNKINLGEIASIDWGNTNLTKSSYVENGNFIAVSAAGMDGRINHFEHNEETVVISAIGANCGVVFFPGEKFTAIKNTITVTPNSSEVFGKYLYWFFSTSTFRRRGAGQPFLSKADTELVEIPLPPLATQKRIAEILDAADALRRKDQELLKKYDELAQAIFIDMFGDSVKNEMGWDVLPISEVVHPDRIITYGIVQAGEHINDGIPYIKTGDIKDGEILTNQLQRTSKEIALSYKRSQLYKGDIVMSIRATVGTVALLPDSLEGANLTQGTARISPSDIIDRTYLYYYLKNDFAQNWISSYAKGATFREITLSKLRQLPVLIPPIEIQSVFNKKLKTIMDSKARNKNLVKNSINLFDSLIQKAFKGELVL